MKRLIFILLFIPLISFSQYTTFIGDESFPSTETLELENKQKDLFVSFIEDDGTIKMLMQTEHIYDYEKPSFNSKINIYLKSGDVITLNRVTYRDYVDEMCYAIYPLSETDIQQITNSDIFSIRYTIDLHNDNLSNRIASNNGYEVGTILKDFVSQFEKTD